MKDEDPYGFDLEKEAPLLSSLKKVHSEGVPAGYFESLEARIMEKVRKEDEKVVEFAMEPQSSRSGIWMVAASVVLLAMVALGIVLRLGNPGVQVNSNDIFAVSGLSISDEAVFDALEMAELDEAEILALVGDETIASIVEDEGLIQDESFEGLDLDEIDLSDLDELDIYEL